MEMLVKAMVFTALLVFLSLCAASAQAVGWFFMVEVKDNDVKYVIPVQQAIEKGKAEGLLSNDIKFYFSGQSHSAIETTLTEDFVAHKEIKRGNRDEEKVCSELVLSALNQLQERARSEGGNAVINIVSFFKKRSFKSENLYECYIGRVKASVTLKGDIVKLKE
ncbi:MAG: hypothetical protein LBI16_02815 [Burkholderiales bacterium]|nr:hypothetical protein [Burkholderiales bacterium]